MLSCQPTATRGGAAAPLALPMGELSRLQAVTERVHKQQSPHFPQICHCAHPLSLASLDSSPRVGAKGGCAAGFPPTYPLRRAGNAEFAPTYPLRRAGSARPLALPMGELARLKAVTERVPSQNPGTIPIYATAHALSVSLRSPAPPEWEPRAAAPPDSRRLTLCAGRAAPAPWLSLWESWHG